MNKNLIFGTSIFLFLLACAVYAGTVTIQGSNVHYEVTKEIEIGAARFAIPASDYPGQTIIGNAYVHQFDASSNESVYAVRHVVPDYKIGSNWSVGVYWSPTNTNTGNVSWCVAVAPITTDNDEVLNVGTIFCTLDAGQGTANEVLKAPLIEIDGSSFSEDDIVPIRVFRGADQAADNYNADASLLATTIYYTSVTLGEDI